MPSVAGIELPAPVIETYDGIHVVRDDLIPGGTKRRALHVLLDRGVDEYVYASTVYGYAQIALAHTARDLGKRATIFCARHKERQPLTRQAAAAGAQIVEIDPPAYLSVVTARAKAYCQKAGAQLVPFGANTPAFVEAMADVARAVPITPQEVWSVSASGTLTRALQLAWPDAVVNAVHVGAHGDLGRAVVWRAPEAYERDAVFPPPFPSCRNYDAKALALHQALGTAWCTLLECGSLITWQLVRQRKRRQQRLCASTSDRKSMSWCRSTCSKSTRTIRTKATSS